MIWPFRAAKVELGVDNDFCMVTVRQIIVDVASWRPGVKNVARAMCTARTLRAITLKLR